MKVLTVGKIKQLSISAPEILKIGTVFLMSRAPAAEMFPFGFAFWTAMFEGRSVYFGLAAMLIGILSADGEILKYSLAAGVYLLYTYFRKNKSVDAFFAGFTVTLAGIVSLIFNNRSGIYAAASVIEGTMTILSYAISKKTENFCISYKNMAKAEREEVISAILLFSILLTGFSGIYVTKYVEISVLLGIYLILFMCRCSGIAAAGSLGLVMGFICSINNSPAIAVMGACGVAALSANLLKEFGKPGISAGFVIGILICAAYDGDWLTPPVGVAETGIAILFFALTPNRLFSKAETIVAKMLRGECINKEVRIKEYLSGELRRLANIFTELAEGFLTLSEKNVTSLQASDMFDRVAERICVNCPKWGTCWIDGFNDMYRYMYEILKVIETRGFCDINNLPIVFKDKCINNEVFIMEFNHMYEIYKQTALWQGEASAGQDMVAKQYHEISNLIKGMSDELESGFSFMESAEMKLDCALEKVGFFAREISVIENSSHEPEVYISAGETAEPELLERVVSETIGMPMRLEEDSDSMKFVVHNKFFAEYAVCQHSGEAEYPCGDTVIQFEADNKFCVLICDGMGAGQEASEESRLTADLFRDFIKAGFIKDTAVKMINSTLAMKAGRESFSTIDLVEIDLRSGETEFLKVGAAESFVKSRDETEIIETKALPVGILADIEAPTVKRNLSEGDIIVMVSDGISETGYGALKGAWVKQLMENSDGNMRELADLVMKNAREKAYPKPCDDMTVAAIRIKKL